MTFQEAKEETKNLIGKRLIPCDCAEDISNRNSFILTRIEKADGYLFHIEGGSFQFFREEIVDF